MSDYTQKAREFLPKERTVYVGTDRQGNDIERAYYDKEDVINAIAAALAEPKAGAVPIGFVLLEKQVQLVLFQGSWETEERWFWPEREQAQAAADRLHETHGFPNDYWLVTPVAAAPQAKPGEQDESYLDALDSLWKLVNGDKDHPVYRLFLKFVDSARPVEVPPSMVMVQRADADRLAKFAMQHPDNVAVGLSARRVQNLLERTT